MPTNTDRILALAAATFVLAAALTGCAATDTADSAQGGAAPAAGGSAPLSHEDLAMLLDVQRGGIAVLAQQWTSNDCSVDLALSPDDIVCAEILAGSDLTASYEELGGGLGRLAGDPAAADTLRTAFELSADAGRAWDDAGCADEFGDDCAEEAEELVSTLLELDDAFEAWAA